MQRGNEAADEEDILEGEKKGRSHKEREGGREAGRKEGREVR